MVLTESLQFRIKETHWKLSTFESLLLKAKAHVKNFKSVLLRQLHDTFECIGLNIGLHSPQLSEVGRLTCDIVPRHKGPYVQH